MTDSTDDDLIAQARKFASESEEKYRLLAENSSDIIARISLEGKRLYTSPSVLQVLGWTPEEILGHSPFEHFHPDDLPALKDVMEKILTRGIPERPVYRSRTKDGRWIWVETTCSPIRDLAGKVTEIHTSTRDITHRVQAESALREREERLQLVLEATSDGVFDWNVETGEVYFSPAYFQMLGYNFQEFPATFDAWREHVHPEDLPAAQAAIQEHFSNSKQSYSIEFRMRHKDGSYRWILSRGKVVQRNSDGLPRRMVGTHTDISQRRKAEDQYRQLFENLTTGFALHEIILNDQGEAIDYRFLEANPAFQRLTSLDVSSLLGKRVLEVMPATEKYWIDIYGKVALGGDPLRYENFSAALNRWYEVWAYRPAPLQFAVLITDITERKRNEEDLRRSEEQYRLLAENSLDVVTRHDVTGKYLWASPSFLTVLGIDPATIVGQSSFDFIHPDDHQLVMSSLQAITTNPQPNKVAYRHRASEGRWVWVESLARALRDPVSREICELLVSTRDITDRKESQRKIEELGVFNQTLLDTSGGLILVLDLHGKIVRFNTACEELAGWKESEVLGLPFFDFFLPPDQRAAVEQAFQNLLPGDIPSRYENDWLTRDGSQRWVSWANSTILDDFGKVKFVVGTGVDRTDQRRIENEILELNNTLEKRVAERTDDLQRANRELESFSYSISHDLRSPLRAIDGFSKALLEDAGPLLQPESRVFLERIRSSSQHMGHLIDDLLELSRSSRIEIQRECLDLSAMCDEILDGLQRQNPDRSLVRKIESGLQISGDPILVRSILENLLGNSWKYSSQKTETILEIGSELVEDRKWIWVKDNGIGFDMAHADKLFGTFQRLHSFQQFEGTGIGLATVRKIVERHGGSVTGRGIPDMGAVFQFTLDHQPGPKV